VPQADAEDGLAAGGQEGTHLGHQRRQVLRVAGAVADDDAVTLCGERREVGVPGRAHHRRATLEERADHIVLGAGVHQQHLERAALVADDIVRGHEAEDLLHVDRLRLVPSAPGVVVGRYQPSLHCPVLTQPPSQRPGVDAGDGGDAFGLEPGAQRTGRGVVAVFVHVGLHHQPLHLDAAGLVGTVQGTGRARRGNAVAADERIGEDEDLAAVRRVGKRLDVSGHGRVEDHLAADRPRRPERTAGHLRAVLQHQLHCHASVHTRTSDQAKLESGLRHRALPATPVIGSDRKHSSLRI
jgi:hypothetical protein